MNLAQTIALYAEMSPGKTAVTEKMAALKAKKKKKDASEDMSADGDTYYGPNSGGMGPSEALGSPE